MVSINESHFNDAGVLYIEAAGLSTDSKPADVAVGSVFLEVNTNKVYLYDGSSWNEVT